jgi:hypothetical protein
MLLNVEAGAAVGAGVDVEVEVEVARAHLGRSATYTPARLGWTTA